MLVNFLCEALFFVRKHHTHWDQGHSQKFSKGRTKRGGSGGWKPPPSGVQGQSTSGGLGALPPEAGDIY